MKRLHLAPRLISRPASPRKRPVRRALAVASLAITITLVSSALSAQEESVAGGAEARLQEAWFGEIVEGRLEDALEVYREIADDGGATTHLRARALYRAAVCLKKLRREDQATETFRQVIARFPAVTEAVAAARRALEGESEAEAAFRRRVEGLIEDLGKRPLREKRGSGRGTFVVENPALESLREIGPDAAPYLLAALGSSNYFVTQGAAELLVGFAEEDARLRDQLVVALRSGDEIVRQSVAKALESPGPNWIDTLVRLSRDETPAVRSTAASILLDVTYIWRQPGNASADLRQQKDRLVDVISERLEDPNAAVRVSLLRKLQSLLRSELITAMTRSLNDPESSVRSVALDALLHQLQQARPADRAVPLEAIPAAELLADESPEIVERTIELLWNLRGEASRRGASLVPPAEEGEAMLARLVAVVTDASRSPETRKQAVELIATAEPSRAKPLVLAALDSDEEAVVKAAITPAVNLAGQEVVPRLVEILTRSEDDELRSKVWAFLKERFATPSTIEALVERLPEIGQYGEKAIGMFRWNERQDLARRCLQQFDRVDAKTREAIVSRTGDLRNQGVSMDGAIEVVSRALADPDPEVRERAVYAAVHYPHPRHVEALRRELFGARNKGAIDALQGISTPEAIDVLVEALRHQDLATMASHAFMAIAADDTVEQVIPLLRRNGDLAYAQPALDVVRELARPEDVPHILEALQDPLPGLRVELVTLLGQLASPLALERLRGLIDDEDPEVRQVAVRALGNHGQRNDLPLVVEALDDRHPEVREAAVEALREREPEDLLAVDGVVPAVAALLDNPAWEIRSAAVDVLGKLDDPGAVPPLLEALRWGDVRPEPRPRRARRSISGRVGSPRPTRPTPQEGWIAWRAGELLRKRGGPGIVPRVLEFLEAEELENPHLNMGALVELVRTHATPMQAGPIGDALLRVPDAQRIALIDVLGSLGSPEALPQLIAVLQGDDTPSARAQAASALEAIGDPASLPALVAAFSKETDPTARSSLFDAIVRFADPQTLPVLLANLREPEVTVKSRRPGWTRLVATLRHNFPAEVAVTTLRQIATDSAYPVTARMHAVEELTWIDAPGVRDMVADLLRTDEPSVHLAAIEALGTYADADHLPRLVEFLRNRNPRIRDAARQAIEAIRFYLNQKELVRSRREGDDGDALSELTGLLSSDSADVRLAAVRSLRRLADPASLPALVRHRKDPDERVQKAIESALDALTRQQE